MIASDDFPRLTPGNHRITSPPTPDYNCIAWANGDTTRWWQPGVFCPVHASPDDCGIGILEQMLVSAGYTDCAMDASLEPAFARSPCIVSVASFTLMRPDNFPVENGPANSEARKTSSMTSRKA